MAKQREQVVLSITPGMERSEVEDRLGQGEPDISGPSCEQCPADRDQMVYKANPPPLGFWYGHLEDNLVVCYVENLVCDTTRVGL